MSASGPDLADTVWEFGAFRLSPARRELLADGEVVPIGGRAFDILAALVERAGNVVARDELTARVWPRTIVEESSLRVQVGLLRRALGPAASFVVTVPGRGYSFVGAVSERGDAPVPDAAGAATPEAGRPVLPLPVRLSPVLGREAAAAALRTKVLAHPLVTVLGLGGVGKSALALTVAEGLGDEFPDGLRYLDFQAEPDPEVLNALLAEAAGRRMLVLLDGCDGRIEAAAGLAAALAAVSPDLAVLATGRERLRVSGEQVVRLPPLDVPPEGTATAAAALGWGAVQLFVERARASRDAWTLSDRDAPWVADLCRRLDGVPLAIEMAAAAVDVLGVRGVLGQLDGPMPLLDRRRRTRHARQQSLRASLDWSHDRLGAREQRVLRRIALFASVFSLDDAIAVAAFDGTDEADVTQAMAALVGVSLVSTVPGAGDTAYRLLAMTRAYAAAKLEASGERAAVEGRFAPRPSQEFTPRS